MSDTQSQSDAGKRGRRYPLLYQQRLSEQVFWVALFIVIVCAALLIWNPDPVVSYRLSFAVILAGTGLILILTQVFRLRAYVQCHEQALRLQLPFYRLDIPYDSISLTRPTQLHYVFSPKHQRWTQRSFLDPLWALTVVVAEIRDFPPSGSRPGLWMSPYMINPDAPGLVIPVRDWMGLRRELDEIRAWRRRRL
jgi:hypothetical protein